MASFDIKKEIDVYFQGYRGHPVQFQDQDLDTTGIDTFISLIYAPVENDPVGMDGTATGRIGYSGLQRIFCYGKTSTKALIVADDVKSYFNGKELPQNIHVEIGQDNEPRDLGNGFHEVLCTFNVTQW